MEVMRSLYKTSLIMAILTVAVMISVMAGQAYAMGMQIFTHNAGNAGVIHTKPNPSLIGAEIDEHESCRFIVDVDGFRAGHGPMK